MCKILKPCSVTRNKITVQFKMCLCLDDLAQYASSNYLKGKSGDTLVLEV